MCTVKIRIAMVYNILNKNTWGVKKCGANQKQHCTKKGGQVTKPIILVKICYNIVPVIQGVSYNYLIKQLLGLS